MAIKKKLVPRFKNDEDAAAWFEKEDMAEYDLEKASDLVVERPELATITIRLDKDDITRLKVKAKKVGVGHTTMARIMLHESLTKGGNV